MSRIAFVFLGQGSQYVNMAKDFYDHFPESRRIFEEASGAAGFSLEELCFTENEKLYRTQYVQPALLTACCAILDAVKKEGYEAEAAAGLSLGEYCALYAASVLRFADAVTLVCERGRLMAGEVPAGVGGMTAVLSKEEELIEEVCAQTMGIVAVANYNCPGQLVISGEKGAVDQASEKLRAAGVHRTVPLKVDGPFHSPMLAGAGKKLRAYLEQVELNRPEISFFSNVTAQAEEDPQKLKDLLGLQVCSPVRWRQSVEAMIREGIDTFVEIGPGHTLSNFVKKINRSVKVCSIECVDDLKKLELQR